MGDHCFTIYPLHLGTIRSFEKSLLTLRRDFGKKIVAHCIGWVLRSEEDCLLVDTGPSDPEWSSKYHWPLEKTRSQELPNALGRLGFDPGEVKKVILTHLHWDHCFNLEYLPNARIFVQKRELEYAVAPLPGDRRAYEVDIPGATPPWMKALNQIEVVNGDREIVPGVRVMHVPGHTPGSQAVFVDTSDGVWVIAGDTVPLFENLGMVGEGEPIPSGLYQNLADFYNSLSALKKYAQRILPGHDREVNKHDRYPIR